MANILLFKKNNLFYLIFSLLFILLKSEEYQNEIIIKTKGPIFCDDNSNEYCYKKNYPFNTLINNIEDIFIIHLKWNNAITNFSYMFYGCDKIIEVDLNITYLSGDITFEYMFANCSFLNLINLFNLNLNYELTSETNLYFNNMFSNCSSLTFINKFNVEIQFSGSEDNKIDMNNMFNGCDSLKSVNIFNIENGYVDNQGVNSEFDINYIFNNCSSLSSINIYNITSYGYGFSYLYLYNMFNGCSSLKSIDIYDIMLTSDHGYYSILDIYYMFNGCTSLVSANIFNISSSSGDANNEIDMNHIFNGCNSLKSVNIYNIISKGYASYLKLHNLFNGCTSLSSVNIYNIISNSSGYYCYIHMEDMFNGCISLGSANIHDVLATSGNRGSSLYLDNMFNGCISLSSIILNNIVLFGNENELSLNETFSGCKNLRYLNMKNFYYSDLINQLTAFKDIPNNIIFCIDEIQSSFLYKTLTKKNCSILYCTDDWLEIPRNKIIFDNNTCIDNCGSYSLYDFNNICYEDCPIGTYKDNFACKDCYISCETCNQSGTEENNNCITYKEGYTYNLVNDYTSYTVSYSESDYDKNGAYGVYINECPIGYDLISYLLFCFDNCYNNKSSNECYTKCKNNKYFFNTDCPMEFPLETFDIQNYNYSCNINNINNTFCLFNKEYYLNREKLFDNVLRELENVVIDESNFNEDEYITIEDQEKQYKYIITSNKNKQYNYEFININFTECENNIIKKNSLSKNDYMYLLIIKKSKNESSYIITEYEIYYFFDKLNIKDTCNFELKEPKEENNNNCPNDFYFIYISNNKCIKYCCIQDRLNDKCIHRYNTNETSLNKTLVNEIQNVILMGMKDEIINEKFIVNYLEKLNYIIIEEIGTKFILTSYNYQKNNLGLLNMTNIDLDKCETELRNSYDIVGNIYLLKIDKELEGIKIPKIEYELYAFLNYSNNNKSSYVLKQLNLTICSGITIYLYIPFNLTEDEYDIYDLKSGYYDDICYTNTTNDELDIALPDRKNEYIENNMTLCEEDCDFERYDYKLRKVICSCLTKIKMPLISEITFDKKKLIEKFKDIKSLINIQILKCYFLLFNRDGIIKNIGFYTVLPVFIFHFVNIFIFSCKDLIKIKKLINDIINTKNNIKNKESKNKNKKIIKKHNPPLKKVKEKKIKDNNIISKNLSLLTKKKRKVNKKSKKALSNFHDSKKKLNSNSNPIINLDNKNNNILDFNATELNLMPYEKALKFDERTYCQYYLNLINYKNILLFTFYLSNDYNSRILKIDLFLNMLIIHFGINALFFTDSTMHQIYEDKGNFNIIYQLPQIIYSSIISLVLNQILKILSLSERNILKLKSLEKDIDEESKCIKKTINIKFILFFILSFTILLFLGFYLSCFCVVYKNTQIYLLKDTLISFGSSFITPLIINLFPGLFRIPALKSNNKRYIYNFSKILQII